MTKVSAVQFNHNSNAISQRQFDEHIKLYNGYVNKTNEVTEALEIDEYQASANGIIYTKYRSLKQSETFAIAGMILHEMYFQNMTTNSGRPCEKTMKIFDEFWGNYDKWFTDFKAAAVSARGWVIFGYEQRTKMYRNIMTDSHDTGIITGFHPLLVLDMYEHAYFLDYATDRAGYISKFMESVNWEVVSQRLAPLQ